MNNITKQTLIAIQVLLSFFVALTSMEISAYFVNEVYIIIEGDYLEPFGGRAYKYNVWEHFLTGALFVVISYIFLYNIKKNTYITATMLFIFNTIYTYSILGEPFSLNKEIILGGLIFIVLYEIVKKINASNK